MILNIYRNLIKNKQARVFTGFAIVFVSIIFLIFPIFVKPEIDEAISRGGRHFSETSGRNEGERGSGRGSVNGTGKGEGQQQLQLQQNIKTLTIEKKDNNTNNISPETKNNEISEEKDQVHSTEQHESYGEGKHRDIPSNIDIMGSMTLIEVADKYNIPVNHIKSKLDVPISISNNERLGRLKRTHGFTMSDVEEIVYNYQKSEK